MTCKNPALKILSGDLA